MLLTPHNGWKKLSISVGSHKKSCEDCPMCGATTLKKAAESFPRPFSLTKVFLLQMSRKTLLLWTTSRTYEITTFYLRALLTCIKVSAEILSLGGFSLNPNHVT
jgi:hypothetical protein